MTVGHRRVRDRPEQTTATEDGGSTESRSAAVVTATGWTFDSDRTTPP